MGTSVLNAARQLGVDLGSVCGGVGLCGRCQVTPMFGDFPKHGINVAESALTDYTNTETDYAVRKGLGQGRRLGCMADICADVVVDIPSTSQVHRQVIRKELELVDLVIDPVSTLHYVQMDPATLEETIGTTRRLTMALHEQWNLEGVNVDPATLRDLQAAGDNCTVAIRDGVVSAVWPGFHETTYGVAIDVGSTTIAGYLLDLITGEQLASGGLMNPQIRFGEDLMSRVSYVMMNEGGDRLLTEAVQEALNDLIGDLAKQASIERHDILEITLVGNPIMHHLFLGLDPRPLGEAPFKLTTDEAINVTASSLDIQAHPNAAVYVLPCIAGHVGADTAGVILSDQPHTRSPIALLVDVGTNAEIVLGNQDRLLAASSPTGPAFEGAQISSGQRAAPGAIERVRIDRETLEPRYKIIGSDAWSTDDPSLEPTGICGSGIIEAVAELFLAGVLSEDGVMLDQPSDRVVADGRTFSYVLADGILVTQNDVRAIQLAKAALYAGVRLLMDKLEIDSVDEIRLAGAFGSHIDVTYAMVLGLIPDCDLKKVHAAGNAAGAGAVMALLNRQARREIETVVRRIEKIETAIEPAFQAHFVEAMAFPHKTAAYPNLSQKIELPQRAVPTTQGRRRRRPPQEDSP
ncbi:MAG: ASKHA domain-containing protein [Acidimicrobiia bacterium]|nr:ASKHA domain-containing protein [Acidimicrobiia bacterium]